MTSFENSGAPVPGSATCPQFVAFIGHNAVARGDLASVSLVVRQHLAAAASQRAAVFDEATGVRFDLEASELGASPTPQPTPAQGTDAETTRARGRPKLGVVCREISLLPRHWEWLATQPGGASAALRRLVDAARKNPDPETRRRQAVEAAHRFLWDIAGDFAGFEEATRALFAYDFQTFEQRISSWPEDIRLQALRFLSPLRESDHT